MMSAEVAAEVRRRTVRKLAVFIVAPLAGLACWIIAGVALWLAVR